MKKRRPTLQDIADQAGITKMTVSRYLKDPTTVAQDTGSRISEAIDLLGYIPNRAPAQLANHRSGAIGVLLPSLGNQLFSDVLRGIESVTDPAGYQTMLAHYGYDADTEEQRIASLLSYNVDALLLSDHVHTARTRKLIELADIPVIEMMDSTEASVPLAVGLNNQAGAEAMAEALVGRGYRHIAYLGARGDRRTLQRERGYRTVMERHGIEPVVVNTSRHSSFSRGAELLHDLLLQWPETDAVMCTNDDIAVGVVFECQRRGIPVPGQLAVAGFHGMDVALAMAPPLASVITPRFRIGQQAAQWAIEALAGNTIAPQKLDLGFTVQIGGTA